MPSLHSDEIVNTTDIENSEQDLNLKNVETKDLGAETKKDQEQMELNQVKPKKRFTFGKVISLFLIISSVFLLGFGAYFVYSLAATADKVIVSDGQECNNIFDIKCLKVENPFDTNKRAKLKGEDEGRTNLLVIGADKAAGLADTIIVISYYYNEKKVVTVNIPRDTFVTTTYPNENNKSVRISEKINAVYPFATRARPNDEAAGANALINLISTEYQIPIHYWAVTNFTTVKQVVDELGGIEINVEKTFTDVFPKSEVPREIKCVKTVIVEDGAYCEFTFQAGPNSLNGDMALIFARSRKYSSDFDRSKRQSEVIQAVAKKAKEKGIFGNINNIRSYLKIFGDNIKTNVQLDEMLSFYKLTENVNVDESFYRAIWSSGNGFLCAGDISAGRGYHITYCGGDLIGGGGNSTAKKTATSFMKNLLFEAQSSQLYNSEIGIIANKAPEATKIKTALQNLKFESVNVNNTYKPITAATTKSKQKITIYIADQKIKALFDKLPTKPNFDFTIESSVPAEKEIPETYKSYPILIWVESI